MVGKDLEISDTAFQRLLSRNESYGPFEPQTTNFASSLPASGPALGKSSNSTIEFSRGLSSASNLASSGLMLKKPGAQAIYFCSSLHCAPYRSSKSNRSARKV